MDTTLSPSARFAAWWNKLPESLRASYRAGPPIMAAHAGWVAATEEQSMTEPTDADFARLALESYVTDVCDRKAAPPDGWFRDFDAAHSYIPVWALGGNTPADAFLDYCQSGTQPVARGAALANSLRRWLNNSDCLELRCREADIRDYYRDRDEDPRTWATYAAMLDDGWQGY
jgi:hypothetical protein